MPAVWGGIEYSNTLLKILLSLPSSRITNDKYPSYALSIGTFLIGLLDDFIILGIS